MWIIWICIMVVLLICDPADAQIIHGGGGGGGGGSVSTWSDLLSSGAMGTSEAVRFSIRGIGGQANNGRDMYQSSGGTWFDVCIVAGVADDCEYIRTLGSGHYFEFRNSSGTSIGRLTESTGAWTNFKLDAEGTGNVLSFKRYKWFPAAGANGATCYTIWDLPASNAAVAACRTGSNTTKGVLEFADGADLSAQLTEYLFEDWTGAIDATIIYEANSTSTNSTVWQLAIACAGDADSDDPTFTYDVFTADAGKSTAHQYNATAVNTVATTGTCVAGDIMHMSVRRDSGHASDNLAATAKFVGLVLKLRDAQ